MSIDNNDQQEETPLQKQVRKILTEGTDIQKAMAHRFEYHIFHAGEMHRIGRAAHEDIVGLIGEWCRDHTEEIMVRPKTPVHVFMDGVLWMVLEFLTHETGEIQFEETSFMFGLYDQPVKEDYPRVFQW